MSVKYLPGYWDARGKSGAMKLVYYVVKGEAILSAGPVGYSSTKSVNLASYVREIFHNKFFDGKLSAELKYGSGKRVKIATTGYAVNPKEGDTVKIYVSVSVGGKVVPYRVLKKTKNSNGEGGFEPIFLDVWKIPKKGKGNAQTVFRIKT